MHETIKKALETPQPRLSKFPYVLMAFQKDFVGNLSESLLFIQKIVFEYLLCARH